MRGLKWNPECVARAKAQGLHLVDLTIDGKFAKQALMGLKLSVGPKTAERVMKLFEDLCDVKKRME